MVHLIVLAGLSASLLKSHYGWESNRIVERTYLCRRWPGEGRTLFGGMWNYWFNNQGRSRADFLSKVTAIFAPDQTEVIAEEIEISFNFREGLS